jgi:hypothetical protein
MNILEKTIYNLVRENPALKNTIRNFYQSIFDAIPVSKSRSSYEIVDRKGFFFGFHDNSPFSYDNKKLLANKANFDLKMPKKDDALDIGYFDGEDFKNFNKVASSRSWSWHLGCKLQWVGKSNYLVFNDHIDGSNMARCINIDNGHEKILPSSLGSVSPDGRWGIGYSFARVQKCMPGYGYIQDTDEAEIDSLIPTNSGIYKIDMDSGIKKNILNISDLAEFNTTPSMKDAKHFFTHTQISPDSKRFMFLHRWIHPNKNIDKRFSRLVVCDINGSILDILNTLEMVSHIGWQDSNHIIAYCRLPDQDNQYGLFKIGDPDATEVVGKGILTSDGHPSFDSTKRWIITDTYPNRRRVQTLILYDVLDKKKYDIAKLFMPKDYQSPSSDFHWACDLHPRWDKHSRFLCFDSTFNGHRSLCTIDLGEDIKNNDIKNIQGY